MTSTTTISRTKQLRRLLDRWDTEEDERTRSDLVLEIQDLTDRYPELRAEAIDAGVPGILVGRV